MHFRALRHALAAEGVEAPDQIHHEIVGRAAKVVYEKCWQIFGLSMSFDQWRRLKYSYYTAHAAEIAVRPGALEAWRLFEQSGLRQALASYLYWIVVNANIPGAGSAKRPGLFRRRSIRWCAASLTLSLMSGRRRFSRFSLDATHCHRRQSSTVSPGVPCCWNPHHRVAGSASDAGFFAQHLAHHGSGTGSLGNLPTGGFKGDCPLSTRWA